MDIRNLNIFEETGTPVFPAAFELQADPEKALQYLKSRWEDARKLQQQIIEKNGFLDYITLGYIVTDPTHTEMFGKNDVQILRFFNLHCAMAYILARHW